MKSIISGIVLALLATVAITTAGYAQNAPGGKGTPKVTHRQIKQGKRIGQGIRSGEITKDEAKELRQGQKEIQQDKKDAKSDGVVTKEERKELHQELNQQSKDIYKAKHNDVKRQRRNRGAGNQSGSTAPVESGQPSVQ